MDCCSDLFLSISARPFSSVFHLFHVSLNSTFLITENFAAGVTSKLSFYHGKVLVWVLFETIPCTHIGGFDPSSLLVLPFVDRNFSLLCYRSTL